MNAPDRTPPLPLILFKRALVLGLVAALTACATAGNGPTTEAGLAAIFNDARSNPDHRDRATAGCVFLLGRGQPDSGFAALMSGLLDVPAKDAEEAYCAAMVEAAIANEMSEANLERLQVPRAQRGMGPFGDMLHKVLVAHERLKSQQAEL